MKTLLAVLSLLTAVPAFSQTGVAGTNDPPVFAQIRRLVEARRVFKLENSEITFDHGRLKSMRIYPRDYAAALHKINTDGLPTSLRVAWFDYVTAWDNRARANPISLIVDLAELHSPTTAVAGLSGLASLGDGKEKTHDAWVEVERASLELGLDISR